MARELQGGPRLTPLESLMWRLEGDRSLSSSFASVTFFDCEPEPERFRLRMQAAVEAVPRFRQRIQVGPVPGSPSWWVDDEHFSLDRHLRWEQCPGEGTDADVLARTAEFVAEPFDPDAPLWDFVVLTGLLGGRAALIQRMHHALTDGEGGIRLSERFVDLERDAADPTPDPFVGDGVTGPQNTWLERTVLNAADAANTVARTTTDLARWAAGGLTDPGRFGDAGAEVVETARSLGRQLAVVEPAHSPLWRNRSAHRRLVTDSLAFEPVRLATTGSSVSINDLFVTATLRGAASYHRALGEPVDSFRVAMPVSTRHNGSEGGNAFGLTRVVLPSGEGLTAAAHLRAVSDQLTGTKHERTTGLIEPIAALADLVPAPLLHGVVRRQAATIDFGASNVRAAPFPLFIAGARIEATYVAGPVAGTAANITMMTYDGRIDLGLHVDTAAVEQPELLRDTVVGAFHESTRAAETLA